MIIFEDDDTAENSESSDSNSLDSQIDSMLVGFEKKSSEKKEEARSLSSLPWLSALLEADDDEEKADDSEEDAEEDVTDNSEIEKDAPIDPNKPKLNIDTFARNVARLVTNYDSLLDIPGAIIDRSMKYVTQYYGKDAADQLIDALDRDYGIDAAPEDNEYPEMGPPGVGSQSSEEGIGGGGGGELGGGLGGAGGGLGGAGEGV